ncbi:hypothetical protein EsDP_00003943 [Epichloe bromicola]|uniref:RNA polymerase III RPC4 n=1 Tax=Epichloe bromicola TaxID=79588 RepID=A0ABQ0CQ85_9HYPO
MVRARATGRGARRVAAAASRQRATADAGEASENVTASTEPAATTPSTLDEAVASASSSTTAPASRGGATAGARTTTAGRLRPKILRRDEADRDKLARQEEQKANERAAAERRARGRSRNRSRRSRGDAMGARGGRGGTTTASGPFSSGFAGAAGGHGGGWFGGGSSAGAGGGFFGGRGGKSGLKGKEFAEANIRQREARINADKLHVMSPEDELDSEDEAMIEALSGRTAITMPMGIYRKEHKEQGVVVATTAELEAAEKATGEEEEESLFVDGEGSGTLPPVDQPEEGVWDTDGKALLIKKEPGTEDPMDLDAEMKPAPTGEEEEEAKEIKKPILAASVKKELPRDPEERAIQSDMDLLASELGAVTVTDEAGVSHTEGPSSKDGRLYLFQFPPLLPPLKEIAQPVFKVKEEAKDINLVDAPSASDATPVDLTNGSGDDERGEEEELEADGFRSQFLSRGGMVGKMTVRKSGKVVLEWGGVALEISPAAGMNFLTTAVIVEENDEKPQHGVAGGECVGMGKIMGRFVLAPIWGEEEDWDVAQEELVAA